MPAVFCAVQIRRLARKHDAKAAELVGDGVPFRLRVAGADHFARQHLAERILDLLQRAALPDRIVVRAEQRVIRELSRQLDDRGIVDGHHLHAFDVGVNGTRIDGVARKEQPVRVVRQHKAVPAVAGRRDHAKFPTAQVEHVTLLDGHDLAGLRVPRLKIEPWLAVEPQRLGRAVRIVRLLRRAGSQMRHAFGQVKQMRLGEAPIVAHVVEVRVGVDQGDRLVRQEFDEGLDVAKAHAGVQQQRGRIAFDQIADDLFEMVRLVDRRDAGRHPVRFEPAAFAGDLFQFFKCSQFTHAPIVSRAGKNDTLYLSPCVVLTRFWNSGIIEPWR